MTEDIGTYLEVPEEERQDTDEFVPEEVNEDEFRYDFSDVPDGEYVELSTATPDEFDEED